MRRRATLAAALSVAVAAGAPAAAQDDADLGEQLADSITALISIPFQFNYVESIGPERAGARLRLNVQPVIPFSLDANWNAISRTIVPVVHQRNLLPGAGSQFGIGDTLQSVFLLPGAPRRAASSGARVR